MLPLSRGATRGLLTSTNPAVVLGGRGVRGVGGTTGVWGVLAGPRRAGDAGVRAVCVGEEGSSLDVALQRGEG